MFLARHGDCRYNRCWPGCQNRNLGQKYGSGMSLLLGLRVKDLDFRSDEITVRQGKGHKNRVTMLPGVLFQPLQDHLGRIHDSLSKGEVQ